MLRMYGSTNEQLRSDEIRSNRDEVQMIMQ